MGQFKFYLLVPHHTPAYSLIANAMLMCRFAPPLAFNFMAALAMPPSDHHAFKVGLQACSTLMHSTSRGSRGAPMQMSTPCYRMLRRPSAQLHERAPAQNTCPQHAQRRDPVDISLTSAPSPYGYLR